MKAVITGRRASQGADRANLQPIEVDSTGLVKLNPLFAWTFPFVQWYVDENKVPRNKLLDQGYRSIGDWHSTAKSADGDQGERAGRWAGKADKTECGLHVDYFKMKVTAEQKVCLSPFVLGPRRSLFAQLKEKALAEKSAPAPPAAPAVETSA